MQRLSHFGSPDAPTPMQCRYLIRELHRFHPLPFHLLMRPIRAQHLMVSLSCLKINISRFVSLTNTVNLAHRDQVTSALPYGTNIYGLGEIIASSGFRRDVGTDGGVGTIQTHWSRDIQDPVDENM
jgi:hypothetical protein